TLSPDYIKEWQLLWQSLTSMGKNSRFWELLGKLTSGEASEEECKALGRLLDEDESNIQYMMSTLDHYWESVGNAPDPLEGAELHVKKSRSGLRKFLDEPLPGS